MLRKTRRLCTVTVKKKERERYGGFVYTNIYREKKIERESMENAYKIERERERNNRHCNYMCTLKTTKQGTVRIKK